MSFVPFLMERWQSTYEHSVRFNLSESGVHPLTLSGLLELADRTPATLGDTKLEYSPSQGSPGLRDAIAALYPGANKDNVVVTSGSAEANYVSVWHLCEPGDEVVFMVPNYFQAAGAGLNLGASVRPWHIREENSWRPDLDELEELVTERTRLILVTHPNNPTGAVYSGTFFDRVVAAAERVGAWVLADEVYCGAEHSCEETPSFFGRYDRLIVTCGLSKAYALPGLRVGWAVTDPATTEALWSRKDYTSLSINALSDRLASLVLQPDVRSLILERTRTILNQNWSLVDGWLKQHDDIFGCVAPAAGAIAMVRYDLPIGSLELVERLRVESDCLLVPGDHFDLPKMLRIGYGLPAPLLQEGLARLAQMSCSLSE